MQNEEIANLDVLDIVMCVECESCEPHAHIDTDDDAYYRPEEWNGGDHLKRYLDEHDYEHRADEYPRTLFKGLPAELDSIPNRECIHIPVG